MGLAAEVSNSKSGARWDITLTILWIVLMAIFVLILNLFWSPRFYSMSTDNGVFAYAGKLVTQGNLPYRDFWDHKPPVVYYVDALAILLIGPTPWAIWWLNVIWASLVMGVFFAIMQKITSLLPSILASAIFLLLVMNPDFFMGGNMTEFFGLLPQVLATGALFAFLTTNHKWWVFVLGFLTSFSFLTKQTCIAIGLCSIMSILYIDFRQKSLRKGFDHLVVYLAGFSLVIILLIIFWGLSGGLVDLINQVIIFNYWYAKGGFSPGSIFATSLTLIKKFSLMPLMILVIFSFVSFAVDNWRWVWPFSRSASLKTAQTAPDKIVFLAILMAIPLEIIFIALGGINYGHYYITLFPSITIAIGYLIQFLVDNVRIFSFRKFVVICALPLGFLGLAWFSYSLSRDLPTSEQLSSLRKPLFGSYPLGEVEEYIVNHTTPEDSVLVWNINPATNFRTNRRIPSRFIYPIPLFSSSRKQQSNFDLFLQDLKNDPPALILAQEHNSSGLPFFGASDQMLCPDCLPEAIDGMRRFKSYIEENYAFDIRIEDWLIYMRLP